MNSEFTRRDLVEGSAAAVLSDTIAATATHAATRGPARKILGISCSPRKGMTTARSVQIALEAAQSVDPSIAVELVDLGGLVISGWSPNLPNDDFVAILPKLQDPAVAGLIIGSPSYFRGLSSLCKAFIERCGPMREPEMLWADKPVGIIATGGFRNGGQEIVIEQIQTAMLCFGMVPAGGRPPAIQGGTVLTTKDDMSGDELGLTTARNTGMRVADLARRLAK